MKKMIFDTMPDGTPVEAYTLRDGDTEATIITYGAILQKLTFHGRNMVYGFDTLKAYREDTCYIGSTVGRTANRTRGDKMAIDGKCFTVAMNDNGRNHLHGGNVGFNRRVWHAEEIGENALTLSYFSPNGEEGYPGNLLVSVTYTLIGNALKIQETGTTDAPTYLGMTNHSYFNASGLGSPIFEQELQVNADCYTSVDSHLIPDGLHRDVSGSAFDFRQMKKIGRDLSGEVTTYDHNFILNGKKALFDGKEYNDAATLRGELATIRTLTTKPCMQVYSGAFMKGKNNFFEGVEPKKYVSLCMETQFEPDFASRGEGILRPGETYDQTTIYILEK